MGLFSTSNSLTSSSSSLNKPAISSDGTPIAPNRTQRAQCWEGRDAYFECLDRNNIVDSIKEAKTAEKQCSKEGVMFEKNCASSWVQYFKKRRVMEVQKAQTLDRLKAEGAQEMPGVMSGGMPPAAPKS